MKDCNENRHEGGYERSLRNGIVGFGITRAECVILRKARQKHLFAVYHGWKSGIAMNIGMKEDMDIADEMLLSNLVSCSTRNFSSATKCTYLQFMVLEGKDCDENAHEGGHGR